MEKLDIKGLYGSLISEVMSLNIYDASKKKYFENFLKVLSSINKERYNINIGQEDGRCKLMPSKSTPGPETQVAYNLSNEQVDDLVTKGQSLFSPERISLPTAIVFFENPSFLFPNEKKRV